MATTATVTPTITTQTSIMTFSATSIADSSPMFTTSSSDGAQTDDEGFSFNVGGIVAGCIVGVVVCVITTVLLILLLVWYQRRKRKNEDTQGSYSDNYVAS